MNTHTFDTSRSHTSHEEYPHKHDQQDGGPTGGAHVGHDAKEQHGEKPSMMQRVRARVSRMKDSIKEHGGRGHDHDHDDEDVGDDEMDTDSEKRGTHTPQSFMPGKDAVAMQHEPKLEGNTAAEGGPVASKPGAYQTSDPTTTKYTPGQDETTLGSSRADIGRPKESEEHPYTPESTPATATHLGGGHSTGDSEIGKEGGHVKLGDLTGRPQGDVEDNPQAPKGGSPANYQSHVADPTSIGYDSTTDQGVMPEGRGSELGERTSMDGIANVPMNNPQEDHQTYDTNPASYVHGQETTLRAEEASNASKDTPFAAHSASESFVPGKNGVAMQHEPKLEGNTAAEGGPVASKPGAYQTLDPTTTKYTPGQDETTLGWSRTDIGRPKESEEQPYAPKSTPATHLGGGRSTGDSEIGKEGGHVKLGDLTGRPQGDVEDNPQAPKGDSPADYQSHVADPTSIGYDSTAAQSFVPGQHRSNFGETTAMRGVVHEPASKPQGHHSSGQEDNLGWSKTDTGMLEGSEMSNESKYTPTSAHSSSTHGLGDEERNAGKLGGVHGSPANLENYPHVLKHSGEIGHAENYEPKVTDPTGGKEIGVTPVLHHSGEMNIHGEPQQRQNIRSSQEESMFEPEDGPRDKKSSSGSPDQFFPEPVTSETQSFSETLDSGSQGLSDEGWHDKSKQKQESYAGMGSSAGAMMADKPKQATSSITSKQGYGGSFDQQSPAVQGLHKKHSEPGGYGENISIATAVVADKAVRAKDVVATKLSYGGSHEEQPVEGVSEGGSVVDTVKGKTGSSIASNVQGSGTQHEVGPTTTPSDISGGTGEGVSMKENLVEKPEPGEHDKALSEVITEALPLHKRKEDVSKAGEEEEGKKVPIKERVTDSEEVAKRLGRNGDTSYDEADTGSSSPGKGVMKRMMDAATSWYHKPDVSPPEDIKEGKE